MLWSLLKIQCASKPPPYCKDIDSSMCPLLEHAWSTVMQRLWYLYHDPKRICQLLLQTYKLIFFPLMLHFSLIYVSPESRWCCTELGEDHQPPNSSIKTPIPFFWVQKMLIPTPIPHWKVSPQNMQVRRVCSSYTMGKIVDAWIRAYSIGT